MKETRVQHRHCATARSCLGMVGYIKSFLFSRVAKKKRKENQCSKAPETASEERQVRNESRAPRPGCCVGGSRSGRNINVISHMRNERRETHKARGGGGGDKVSARN